MAPFGNGETAYCRRSVPWREREQTGAPVVSSTVEPLVTTEVNPVSIMGVNQFHSLFRKAAGLDVDRNDVKRLSAFLEQKIHDMLTVARGAARANGRDVIQPQDLPVTKGLQESIHRFRELEEDLALEPILERLATLPQLEIAVAPEVEQRLPELVGGISVALATTFKLLDPELKNPQTEHWERVEAIFATLL